MGSIVFGYKKTASETLPPGKAIAGPKGDKGLKGIHGPKLLFSNDDAITSLEIEGITSTMSANDCIDGDIMICRNMDVFTYDDKNNIVKYSGHIKNIASNKASMVKYVIVSSKYNSEYAVGFPTNASMKTFDSSLTNDDFTTSVMKINVKAVISENDDPGDVKYSLICLLRMDISDTKNSILNDSNVYQPALNSFSNIYKKVVFSNIGVTKSNNIGDDNSNEPFIETLQSMDRIHPFGNGISSRLVRNDSDVYTYSKKETSSKAVLTKTTDTALNSIGRMQYKISDGSIPKIDSSVAICEKMGSKGTTITRNDRGGDTAYFSSFETSSFSSMMDYIFLNPNNEFFIEAVDENTGETSIARTDIEFIGGDDVYATVTINITETTVNSVSLNVTIDYTKLSGYSITDCEINALEVAQQLKPKKIGTMKNRGTKSFTFSTKSDTEYIITASYNLTKDDKIKAYAFDNKRIKTPRS